MNRNLLRINNLLLLCQFCITISICFLLFFQVVFTKLTPLSTFADEIILACILVFSLIRAFSDIIVRRLMIIYCSAFLFFLAISIVSIADRGLISVIIQVFIHLKFILFVAFIWSSLTTKYALKVSYTCLAITIVFLLINLLSGNYFNELFDVVTQKRGGGIRPLGIQGDTASLGTTLALMACLLITSIKNLTIKVKTFFFMFFSIIVLFTTVRTALLFIPLIILWWLKDSIKSFSIALLLILVALVPLKSSDYMAELIDITNHNIESTIENPVEAGYIRGIMIYFSFELANDRFPLGTGAATYGTVMSTESHIYAEIGLHNSHFFIDKEGIYDSNFASILGEFGYLGLLIYFIVFYLVLMTPSSTGIYTNEAEFRFVFFFLICGYSIATPIFMNTYPAFILALVLVSSYKQLSLKRSC
jgi:hypothetical protein